MRRGSILPGAFLITLLLAVAVASVCGAQSHDAEFAFHGQVRKGVSGQSGVAVTLHRVSRNAAGPIGTAVTNATGEFTLRVPAPDTAGFTVYFTTADYQGIRYFGPPLQPGEPSARYTVEVYDTAAARPGADRVRVAQRSVILLPTGTSGWQVNEILQVHNHEKWTLVSAGERPTVELPIPEGAVDFSLAAGELALQDVRQVGSRIRVMSPLRPGLSELLIRYRLEDGIRLELPVVHPTSGLEVLVRQPAPDLEVIGLSDTGVVEEAGESFLRFAASDLAVGESVMLEETTPVPLPSERAVTVAALALLVLALGTGALLRRRGSPLTGAMAGKVSASVAQPPLGPTRHPPA